MEFQRSFDRRRFLKAAGAVAATAAAASVAGRAAAWGEPSAAIWNGPQYKVLEIFLYGGLSPWETFYHRPQLPDPWYELGSEVQNIQWGSPCGPSSPTESAEFAADGDGQTVHFGPFTKPLWNSALFDRMRLVVLSHFLPPHEAAVPYALTGRQLGRAELTGMGAPIQRFWQEQSARALPYSYACVPDTIYATDNLEATTAVGLHGGSARPLRLTVGPGSAAVLAKLNRGTTAARDALLDQYRGRYKDLLRPGLSADPARSKAFRAYEHSLATLVGAGSLKSLLEATPFALPIPSPAVCPTPSPFADLSEGNRTATSIGTAAHLLTDPTNPARYVCCVDGGYAPIPDGGGYDTHGPDHAVDTALNLSSLLSELVANVRTPADPPGARKIDLDDTLVVLNTEFGRGPMRGTQDGRDHWPQGYVVALIGGPVQGSSIAGAIDDSGYAMSNQSFTATDVHAAALMSAGIDPFADGNFGIGDLSAAVQAPSDEGATAANLRLKILGLSS